MEVSDSTAPSPLPPQDDGWDEAQLEAALARLQQQHLAVHPYSPFSLLPRKRLLPRQLRQLRDTIPSLVRPVHAAHALPELAYAEFAGAANAAGQRLQAFTTALREPSSTEIRTRVANIQEQHGADILSWDVTQHPGWLLPPASRDGTLKVGAWEERLTKKVGEGVEDDVGEFRQAHPNVEVQLNAAAKSISVRAIALHAKAVLTRNQGPIASNINAIQHHLGQHKRVRGENLHRQLRAEIRLPRVHQQGATPLAPRGQPPMDSSTFSTDGSMILSRSSFL